MSELFLQLEQFLLLQDLDRVQGGQLLLRRGLLLLLLLLELLAFDLLDSGPNSGVAVVGQGLVGKGELLLKDRGYRSFIILGFLYPLARGIKWGSPLTSR